jgi:hypothetical protein
VLLESADELLVGDGRDPAPTQDVLADELRDVLVPIPDLDLGASLGR